MSPVPEKPRRLSRLFATLGAALFAFAIWWALPGGAGGTAPPAAPAESPGAHAGPSDCRACHETFHETWASSPHGLAMRPFSPEFARENLTPHEEDLATGGARWRFDVDGGAVIERGASGEKRFPVACVLGGKNAFYFLAPLERGMLQTMPLAYDAQKHRWFDTAESALRHFPSGGPSTFGTSCRGCHAGGPEAGYDPATDSWRATRTEPGISCEACHGPTAEHARVCREAPPGAPPSDLRIIRGGRSFTKTQNNDTCAPCHARAAPLTKTFAPGEGYFDHFDLGTLEDPGFSPDGRDIGENHTLTLWRMSLCAKSGTLDCLHCHTPGGGYRFAEPASANDACLPCHDARVRNAPDHTRHKEGSAGNLCVSCHMPKTGFARTTRSDHSMLPPAPSASAVFGSKNACAACHPDRGLAWADAQVRSWRARDYQAPVLFRAALLDAARRGDHSRLREMLAYVASPTRDEIYAASIIRALAGCRDARKYPGLRAALADPSPLVRAAAAAGLSDDRAPPTRAALLSALADPARLVRVRAAEALPARPGDLSPAERARLAAAEAELFASFDARPDDWSARYRLGNLLLERGQNREALAAFAAASRLRPDAVPPLVNAARAHAALGETAEAEKSLRAALSLDGASAPAHFNLGLVMAERGDAVQAEAHLRMALAADPALAEAAYNLGVLVGGERPSEAVTWLAKARGLRPEEPRYGYALAFYLRASGHGDAAADLLRPLAESAAPHVESAVLLGDIREQEGKRGEARALYRKVLARGNLPAQDRARIEAKLKALGTTQGVAKKKEKPGAKSSLTPRRTPR